MMDDRQKEQIDQELSRLERQTPSMRFTKDVVELVKTETDLIQPKRNPLSWVPGICIGGFALTMILLVMALLAEDTPASVQVGGLAKALQNGLLVLGALVLFFGLDKLTRLFMLR